MESLVHDDALRTGLETRTEVVDVPFPNLVADALALGILTRSEWVINNPQVSTKAHDADANANSVILTACRRCPSVSRAAIRRDVHSQQIA